MSIQAEMRILPVVVQKYSFLDHQRKVFNRGELKVKILQPIQKDVNESVEDFAQRAHEVMNETFEKFI